MKTLITSLILLASTSSLAATNGPLFLCISPQTPKQAYVVVAAATQGDLTQIYAHFGKDFQDLQQGLNETVLQSELPTVEFEESIKDGFISTSLLSADSEDLGYKVTNTGFIQIVPLSPEEIEEQKKTAPQLEGFNFTGLFLYDKAMYPIICTQDLQ